MRVFITGAAGFIGSATTTELIANGHKVLGLARSDATAKALEKLGAEVHRGSLDDLDSLRKRRERNRRLIHLAFIHDFSKFAESGQIDKRAIDAMGDALAGSGKPFIVTSGTLLLAPGRIATEKDPRPLRLAARASESRGPRLAAQGVRAMAVRLPQVHRRRQIRLRALVLAIAREKGVSAYIGDGSNRWPAVHRATRRVSTGWRWRRASAGASYHAVGEEGVTLRDIAGVIGRRLKLPVVGLSPEKAADTSTGLRTSPRSTAWPRAGRPGSGWDGSRKQPAD